MLDKKFKKLKDEKKQNQPRFFQKPQKDIWGKKKEAVRELYRVYEIRLRRRP